MNRFAQSILWIATLVVSWLAMQIVHELGHVLGARLSGERVAEVVLHPLTISYTRLAENPHPLFVTWMGPLVGVLVPLVALAAVRRQLRGTYLVQFFAGFALIANGAYVAFGSINHIGDAGDLLRHGATYLLIWMFGVTTISAGLAYWHGLGPHFGMGPNRCAVDRGHAWAMLAAAAVLIAVEIVFTEQNQ